MWPDPLRASRTLAWACSRRFALSRSPRTGGGLGPGSCRGHEVVGSHGRRPAGWWEFNAGDLEHPGYFRERSYLYEHNVLGQQERVELEAAWKTAFDAARGMD